MGLYLGIDSSTQGVKCICDNAEYACKGELTAKECTDSDLIRRVHNRGHSTAKGYRILSKIEEGECLPVGTVEGESTYREQVKLA